MPHEKANDLPHSADGNPIHNRNCDVVDGVKSMCTRFSTDLGGNVDMTIVDFFQLLTHDTPV